MLAKFYPCRKKGGGEVVAMLIEIKSRDENQFINIGL